MAVSMPIPSKKRANGVKNDEKRRALPADVIRACVPYARPFSRFGIDRGNIGKNGRFCPVSLTFI